MNTSTNDENHQPLPQGAAKLSVKHHQFLMYIIIELSHFKDAIGTPDQEHSI